MPSVVLLILESPQIWHQMIWLCHRASSELNIKVNCEEKKENFLQIQEWNESTSGEK